jgi:membrane-bound lytic murein transglycosylase B
MAPLRPPRPGRGRTARPLLPFPPVAHRSAVTRRCRVTLGMALAVGLLAPVVAFAEVAGSWSYLVDRLATDGIDRERAVRLFADPRMPPFTGLDFSLRAHESRALYRPLLRAPSLAAARHCRAEFAASFDAAERATGVPASVVAAILHVETGCGRNTGSSLTVYRLARLAMANEPANLRANIERVAGTDPERARQMRERARYLEDTFYPEVRAVFELGDRLGVDPLTLRGSTSGAFGVPQFLPTSYVRYASDADGDGRADLFDVADAAASCARYLAAEGWREGLPPSARRAVIWRYNRSDAYVATVLAIARAIDDAPVRTHALPVRAASRARLTRHVVKHATSGRPRASRQLSGRRPAAEFGDEG